MTPQVHSTVGVQPLGCKALSTLPERGTPILPRRVLHVLNSAAGGAALSTIGLIQSLGEQGVTACAVCHDAGSPAERARLSAAVGGDVLFTPLYWLNRKIRAALWKRPLLEARQLWQTGWIRTSASRVAAFAREQQVDLIHTNTILNPEGGLAARRLGLPHVWHLRELLGPRHPFTLGQSQSRFAQFVRRHASLVVANSEITAATARDWIPAELMRVVPNGIDISRFQPHRERRDPNGPLVVAMVASLSSKWKKHALFVAAAGRLADLPDVEFRIYGHDSTVGGTQPGDGYAAEIHRLVRESAVADRFRWPGHVGDPTQIMAEIDLLVHSADQESFGRTAVEAMAAGLPVVGVRGGGVAEIVVDGETGYLATADDPEALAEAIRRIVVNPELRAQFGAAGRRRAEERYSLASCAASIARVYEEAMLCTTAK